MTTPLRTVLGRLVSQDVARTNAAQASVRLVHDRRRLEHVEAFLSQHQRDRAHGHPTGSPEAGRGTHRGP